jgi:CRP-like cAMP-binding protein
LTHEKIAQCEPGQIFGEIAIIMNGRRTATIKASNMEVFLATLDKESYHKVFHNCTSEINNKISFIEKLFPTVPEKDLIRISYDFILKEFAHHQYIYKQNDPSDCFYFLLSGEVRL